MGAAITCFTCLIWIVGLPLGSNFTLWASNTPIGNKNSKHVYLAVNTPYTMFATTSMTLRPI